MKIKANEFTLEGKTVIILGGSSGLGFATAQAAAHEGAKVLIVSGNENRINEALKSLPENCKGFAVDLSKEENIKQFLIRSNPSITWYIPQAKIWY
jgi:NAD(P)-dependent dehydrogenase (short-subunit alcohol dehydrogenase family)